MTNRSFIGKARHVALTFHHAQSYGDVPYEVHLQDVVNVLLDTLDYVEIGDEVIAAAWLHDVVEDTPFELADIEELFGYRVRYVVDAVSGEGDDRKARNQSIYDKIGRLDPALRNMAALVKVADRIANLEHSDPGSKYRTMYRNERAAFYNAVARYADDALIQRLDAAYQGE
jgi:(p)ppGpp synthase/HD superfamily hydrolase